MIANGVLISGMAGGDRTARGFIDGYDPKPASACGARGPFPSRDRKVPRRGLTRTCPMPGSMAAAQPGSPELYDPQLDLFYIGTGNAEPYNPKYRAGMDSLYAASMLAIRPKTGEMVWLYQFMPNDSFDFDGTAEPIIADIQIDGKPRKVLFQANKNGFLYVLDRTNGQLLAAHPFMNQNWAKNIDLKTGRPVLTDLLDRAMKGETIELAPRGATNATLSAYNAKTGLMFINSWELMRVLKFVDVELRWEQATPASRPIRKSSIHPVTILPSTRTRARLHGRRR